jgi:hypothetical protein
MAWKKDMTLPEVAQLIERFLDGKSLYPQEWNDFVDTPQKNKEVDKFRRRCYELDPLVNRPGDMDSAAVAELRGMVKRLRSAQTEYEN